MSPLASLTTNVLPSRILTSPSFIAARSPAADARAAVPGKEPLHAHEQPPVALDLEVAAEDGRDGVQLARCDLVEDGLVRPDRCSPPATLWRVTAMSPLSIVTNQRSVFRPATRSNRVQPVALRSSGSWPRSASCLEEARGRDRPPAGTHWRVTLVLRGVSTWAIETSRRPVPMPGRDRRCGQSRRAGLIGRR